MVHTHGCLAVMQAKLETELITLLTGAQVRKIFFKTLFSWKQDLSFLFRSSPFLSSSSPLSALLLLFAQVFEKISFVPS